MYFGTPDSENALEINEELLNATNLANFNMRKSTIEQIINNLVSEGKFTVNINLENINVQEKYLEKFVNELVPRLKEIGATALFTNNNILSVEFLNKYGL